MRGLSAVKPVAGVAGLTLVVALLSGCGSTAPAPATSATSSAKTTIRIATLKGPTTMGLVKLMSDAEAGKATQDYQTTMYGTPDEVVPLITKGTVDVAMLPSNLASVLYNKTKTAKGPQIQVAAINTLGVLELVESGNTIKSVADLKGTTIYSTGKGASPEYDLDYLLKSNGLDPATDVTVEFKSEPTELAAILAAKPGAIGVLPQPFVTVLKSKNPAVRTALSFTKEWAKVAPNSQLVTGVVVVRKDFADKHRAEFNAFLTDYKASAAFTNAKPALAAPMIVKAGIVPTDAIAVAAIPACNITYIEGAKLKTLMNGFLKVLFTADAASIGGSLPGNDFYYRR
jgi:NitT/TauT family transport system substrate-binding protein